MTFPPNVDIAGFPLLDVDDRGLLHKTPTAAYGGSRCRIFDDIGFRAICQALFWDTRGLWAVLVACANADVAHLLVDEVPLAVSVVLPLAGIEDIPMRSLFAWFVGHGAFGRKTTSGPLIHST